MDEDPASLWLRGQRDRVLIEVVSAPRWVAAKVATDIELIGGEEEAAEFVEHLRVFEECLAASLN